MRKTRTGAVIVACTLAATGLGACGGSDSGKKVSSASLKNRLMPASFLPGFRLQRTFDWSDPIDLVVEGMRLPEAAHPSDGVKAVKDSGFEGATGENLVRGKPPEESITTIGVVKLGSAGDALKLRDWMHRQDLQQPCFSACIFRPSNLAIPKIATAKAVRQLPTVPPPPGGGQGPPTFFLIEFTVGPYLYFSVADADRSDTKRVVGVAQRYYERVRKLGG